MVSSESHQFDDAPGENQVIAPVTRDPRAEGSYIDDELLEWSEADGDEGSDDESLNEEDFEDNRVEDEDWEIAERGTPAYVHVSAYTL